jgi:SAM-dependent methyltransferase
LSAPDADLIRFYEQAYSSETADAERNGRWRALGAVMKAEHVVRLCTHAGLHPRSTLEVGCGDGALLCELHRRGFGGELAGLEITQAAVQIARQRQQIASVELYDGHTIPTVARAYELGILSHVLEHVRDPPALLSALARACETVLIEVPLEDNLSARRLSKREHAAQVGHLQRLSRERMRAIIASAGLRVVGELEDPLPLSAHRFFASTTRARVGATAKWALRSALHRSLPSLARRLYTVHYTALCQPRDGARALS